MTQWMINKSKFNTRVRKNISIFSSFSWRHNVTFGARGDDNFPLTKAELKGAVCQACQPCSLSRSNLKITSSPLKIWEQCWESPEPAPADAGILSSLTTNMDLTCLLKTDRAGPQGTSGLLSVIWTMRRFWDKGSAFNTSRTWWHHTAFQLLRVAS